ncbi:MAG: hypothetical protein HYT50_00575 [Candidatus Wildermuthbacteria bacterium]|nr:hypothetical protein [Candidatus Wildermuthbacteria bacterium]
MKSSYQKGTGMLRIIAVCEHTGGAIALIPVVQELQKYGHQAVLIAGGESAANALREAQAEFETHLSAKSVFKRHQIPNVLVMSLCSTTGLIEDCLGFVHGKCPTVGLQGPGGGGITDAWKSALYRPDYMCVQEETDAAELLDAWKGFPRDHVWATGFSNLDRYIGYDAGKAAEEMRFMHRIGKEVPVVLFVGDTDEQTSEELAEVAAVLNEIGKEVVFIARPHPRMKEEISQAFVGWQKSLDAFTSGRVIHIDGDIQPLIALADVVIGRGSTAMMEAAYLRKQVISIFYPNVGALQYFRATGRKEFLWVVKGCVAKAANHKELRALVEKSFAGALGLARAQEKHLPHDGPAGRRIAQHVISLSRGLA